MPETDPPTVDEPGELAVDSETGERATDEPGVDLTGTDASGADVIGGASPDPTDLVPARVASAPRPAATASGTDERDGRLSQPWWRDPGLGVAVALTLVWAVTFFVLARRRHEAFQTFGFDLGIYDQGTWLLSELRDPFVTVRGMNLFGHHMNLILLVLAPAYWLGAGPIFLLFVQVASQALGAVGVYLLALGRTANRIVAVALVGVLLLNPTYQFLVWEFFHPSALAIGPVVFAYWAARERRWGWFAVAASIAALCREEIALVVAFVGLLVVLRGDRRVGAVIALVSVAYFAFAVRVAQPFFNDGVRPMSFGFFGQLGDDPVEVGRNVVAHPGDTFAIATDSDRVSYYGRLLTPFAFAPLLMPHVWLVALPILAINVLTVLPFARDYRYHYSAMLVTAGIIATVEAIGLLRRRPRAMYAATAVVVVFALGSSYAWGLAPGARLYDEGYWPLDGNPRAATIRAGLDLVPDDTSVSAAYTWVPHLSHREAVYEFPVPWEAVSWGHDGEDLPYPESVEWLALDRTLLDERTDALARVLLAADYETVYDVDGVVIARRGKAEG